MIELRWLRVKVRDDALPHGSSCKQYNKYLQYRTLTGFGETINGVPQGQWSDWQDVPEVSDDK